MAEENRDGKQRFKSKSIKFIILEIMLIAIAIFAVIAVFTGTGDIQQGNIGAYQIENFSMEKFALFWLIFTVFMGVLIAVYIINGLFSYNIASTGFVENIGYKKLFVVMLVIMLIGAISLFLDLTFVKGIFSRVTWGRSILEICGLVILAIASFVGTFKIINEVKKIELQNNTATTVEEAV